MSTPAIDLMHAHASVRHYKPEPIPVDLVESIVSAGQRAATSSNLQAYSVIAVSQKTRLEELSSLAENQAFIREAPLCLVWCADLARLDQVCRLRGTQQVTKYMDNFIIAAVDAALAAQNSALAAESLGLGMCYIGAIRGHVRQVISLLGLPRLVFPLFGMSLGWPLKPGKPKPRLPLPAILHWECYNTDQEAQLNEYDATMRATGIYTGRQVAFPGRAADQADYGWLEHTARRVALAARTDLRQLLQEQGFGLE
jgi:FMN reductase (NADPH)